MIDKGWIAKDLNNVKYVLCKKGMKPREMPEELYKKAWKEFYSRWGKGEDQTELRIEIYYKYDGMPRKQCGFAENAFFQTELQELCHILEETPCL